MNSLRNALQKMDAGPSGSRKIIWTSLREEPVLVRGGSSLLHTANLKLQYVKSRPHVLRLLDKPLTNVEYVS
jgi:hypothetical protein